ncbi:MAG: hypothetical protein WAU88_13170 [Candidatus Zixiibacteriota bacterium]
MRGAFFTLALVLGLVSAVTAAGEPKCHVMLGFGIGNAGDASGPAAAIDVSIVQPKTLFSIRVLGCSEVKIWGKVQSVGDVSILGGIRKVSENSELSIEGGAGFVHLHVRETVMTGDSLYPTSSQMVNDETVGLALQGKFFWRGIGGILYGNINSKSSFVGALVAFRIGKW